MPAQAQTLPRQLLAQARQGLGQPGQARQERVQTALHLPVQHADLLDLERLLVEPVQLPAVPLDARRHLLVRRGQTRQLVRQPRVRPLPDFLLSRPRPHLFAAGSLLSLHLSHLPLYLAYLFVLRAKKVNAPLANIY